MMAGTLSGRQAVLVGIVAAIVLAVLGFAASPALGGSAADDVQTYHVSRDNVSALRLAFTVETGPGEPTVDVSAHVGDDNDHGRAYVTAIHWNDTGWHGSSTSWGDHPTDMSTTFQLAPEHSGLRHEITVLASPEAQVNVTLETPDGGTVRSVDVDATPLRYTVADEFDSTTGAHATGVTAARYEESTSYQEPVVAVAELDSILGPDAARHEVTSPGGCTLNHTGVDAVFLGLSDSNGWSCPPDVEPPKGGFVFGTLFVRTHEPGPLTVEGSQASVGETPFIVSTGLPAG